MTKVYKYDYTAMTGNTAAAWKFHTPYRVTLVDNSTGKTPVRIDKVLAQLSFMNYHTSPKVLAAFVELSDIQGNFGPQASMTDAEFTTMTEKWQDYLWMTDIRLVGTSQDEQLATTIEFAADTKRLLQPGQKLALVFGTFSSGDSSATSDLFVVDAMCWYSPAAQ